MAFAGQIRASHASPAPAARISAPDSAEERQADRIADAVMRGSAVSGGVPTTPTEAGTIHRQCASCAAGGPACSSCANEEGDAGLLFRQAEAGGQVPGGATSLAARAVSGAGQPLPTAIRSYFEPRMGSDLGQVRIHTDARAGIAARAIHARAYALGNDIAFSPGSFCPQSQSGKQLIAHELAHVATPAAHRPGQVQRDLLEDAQNGSLHSDELVGMTTADVEGLLSDLHNLILQQTESSLTYEGLVVNITMVEGVLQDRYGVETSPQSTPDGAAPAEDTAPVSAQPDFGTGAFAAWQGVPIAKTVEQTHWGSTQSRATYIFEYAEYARQNGLTALAEEASNLYPEEALGMSPIEQHATVPSPDITEMFQIQPLAQAPAEGRRVVRRIEIFVPEVSGPGGILPTRMFSNAYEVGETYMTQDAPDPSAGWNFDTYIDGPAGRIPAQHMGGTRYRVLMGSPECPGCHFGRGLVVDLKGQSFVEVLVPPLLSGLSAMNAMRGTTALQGSMGRPPSGGVRVGPAPAQTPSNVGGQVIPIRPPTAVNPQMPQAAFSGQNALALQPSPATSPFLIPQTRPVQIPFMAPANNNAYFPFLQPSLAPSTLPLTTSLLTGTSVVSGMSQAPAAGQGPQTGDRNTPCDYPLPIAWPAELPDVPFASLVRSGGGQRTEQGRMQRQILAARGTNPPPQPCDPDVENDSGRWNDPYDAHHMHPLFLGGGDSVSNLCSLNAAFHQSGHPRLTNQSEYLDVYRQCGINTAHLYNHPIGQVYYVDAHK